MTQQGDADPQDWWQRLYEDPREGPPGGGVPAPRGTEDTLESRYSTASAMLTGPPEPPASAPPAPEPPAPAPPAPAPPAPEPPEPTPPAAAPPELAPPAAERREPGPPAPTPPAAAPPAPGPPAPERREPAPPAPERREPEWFPPEPPRPAPDPPDPRAGLLPRPRPAEDDLPEAPAERKRPQGTPGSPGAALPSLPPLPAGPPPGSTRYALGHLAVPPAPPAGGDRTGPATTGGADDGAERRPEVRYLGDRPPTYAAEPGALPVADPAALDGLVPDTVLEGARYGGSVLRAGSVRGDSARYRGEARRDFLLTARFGTGDDSLVLVALAGGDRAAEGAREAAAELCHWVGAAVGRSQGRLGEDIRAGRRDALRSGLQRLTDRGYGRLRARAAELGLDDPEYTAGLRCLLLPIDPECRTRVSFGTGPGGLFRLRAGEWQDLEAAPAPAGEDGAAGGFRFRASVARPGDTLLLCTAGLAEPMREEPLLPAELAARWTGTEPPGLAGFLADTQLRLKGYADDRTAAAVWEA
ncbi:protein phosphatase 2C domain-containing protein [Streptomyces sp. NPDC051211]|uniref:protein phosphatase 2C domain-containing protein n=1 Tax=Streptomyces sp. NPDC051211 TaxID=3154643 RepID=UPI00344C7040